MCLRLGPYVRNISRHARAMQYTASYCLFLLLPAAALHDPIRGPNAASVVLTAVPSEAERLSMTRQMRACEENTGNTGEQGHMTLSIPPSCSPQMSCRVMQGEEG
jgi:hypothetical protein